MSNHSSLAIILSMLLTLTSCSDNPEQPPAPSTSEAVASTSALSDNQQTLKTTLYKLQSAIDANELDADFMTHLRETCTYLHELEDEINKDNAQAISELAEQAESNINKIDTTSLTDEGKDLVTDIHATVKRINKKANKFLNSGSSSTDEGISYETTPITKDTSPTESPTISSSEVTTEEITVKEDTPEETLTPTPEIKTETGGYTAGGYASTKPITKYKDNGLEHWTGHVEAFGFGIMFRDGETQDLHNWVEAGYTRWRTVDNRIASRKGGADNPRIAEYFSLELDENRDICPDYTYNMVTVMKGSVDKTTKDYKEARKAIESCHGAFSSYGKEYDENKAINEFLAKDEEYLESILNFAADDSPTGMDCNVNVQYNCRNYCGDFIYMTIGGYKTVKSLNDGETAKAGTDYILSCPSDPSAFKLVEGEELKQYYEVYNMADLNGNMYIDRADLLNRMGTDGCPAYVGIKPGIYDCKVTIPSTGDTFDITIENLPVSYSEFRWGCSTHEEMDACVAFMQGCEYGVYNQIRGEWSGQSPKTFAEISLVIADDKEKLTAVDKFNSYKYETYDGDVIQLNSTKEAAEWVCHLPGPKTPMYFDDDSELQLISGISGHASISNQSFTDYTAPGPCKSYNALKGILYGAGDCESTSATMSCMYNVLGYTTRYITGGNHAWFEVKVPSSITKSGKDEWMMVNDGIMTISRKHTMVRTTVGTEQKGFDNSWWQLCKDGYSMEYLYEVTGVKYAYPGKYLS